MNTKCKTKESATEISTQVLQENGYNFLFNPSKCAECGGKCCYGESGYIFVSLDEISIIAGFLNMTFEETCLQYVKKVSRRFSLIEKRLIDNKKGVACIFFDEQTSKCQIYSVRPKQCRSFPFWSIYQKDTDEILQRCIGVTLNS